MRGLYHNIWCLTQTRQEQLGLNSSAPSARYVWQWTGSALFQVMACHLFGIKPLPEPMLTYCQLNLQEQTSVKFKLKYKTLHSWKCMGKCLRNGGHFEDGWIHWSHWTNNCDLNSQIFRYLLMIVDNLPTLHSLIPSLPSAAYMRQWIGSALVQDNGLLGYCQLDL